jgi:hypothetical protein
METIRNKKWIWKVVVIVSSIALIGATFLPYMALMGK